MRRVAPARVIFLDAAGTLFHVKGSVGEAYLSLARKYGVTADHDTIQQAFVQAFEAAPPPVFAGQDPKEIKACERLWWFDVVHHVFYRVGMFEGFDEYFEEIFSYFSRPDAWELYEDTVWTLAELAAREIELGIVSNFDSRLYEILIGLDIDRFFESVTLSSFAGAAKPSPTIFQRALRKHGVTAGDALHIGNSLRDDARAAAAAGLQGVFLDREGREAIPPDVVAIKSLGDVLTLVGERQDG